jgi:hypothetical protein
MTLPQRGHLIGGSLVVIGATTNEISLIVIGGGGRHLVVEVPPPHLLLHQRAAPASRCAAAPRGRARAVPKPARPQRDAQSTQDIENRPYSAQPAIWPRARGRRLAPIPGEIVSASGEGRRAEVFGCCVSRGGSTFRYIARKSLPFCG